ncbi:MULTISPECIES: sensor histidine kinase [Arcicella]|uniref:Sensor histidine kinase n=1 Tax=Arcicella lustrica TaxID=2984196 RepID=A0ABU5SG48_9BACT|nr:sensor histidine kinase [Arcicella sp. DC25W]MEA5426239.1 sensor histidine kinase [Arcicella sp. DC25W]
MQAYIQRNRILLIHLSFWCVYFSFFYYQVSFTKPGEEPDLVEALVTSVLHVGFVALVAYINYFIFLPRFLKNKNLVAYLFEFLPLFAIMITAYIYVKRYQMAHNEHIGYFYSSKFIVQQAVGTFFIVIFVGMLKFAEDWLELEAKRKEVENEKLMAELTFLKAQINPHFLFNTLNNLYYLAFTNSPNTTEVIAKLSQMMRYMIYDSNHAKVLLSKEIEYIENYISLEKLRLNNQIPISFEIEGNITQAQIVPLILITFLENAFKHGVSNNSTDAFIAVKLLVSNESLIYTVENSKLKSSNHEKSGIGLRNVSRRLDLSYANKYQLDVEDGETNYKVKLTLVI